MPLQRAQPLARSMAVEHASSRLEARIRSVAASVLAPSASAWSRARAASSERDSDMPNCGRKERIGERELSLGNRLPDIEGAVRSKSTLAAEGLTYVCMHRHSYVFVTILNSAESN